MQHQATVQLPSFSAHSLVASGVGTWERDPKRGLVHFDSTCAEIFGFSEEEARDGVSMDRIKRALHPDDRKILSDRLRRIQRKGGLIVLEYRTRPSPGVVRWVLVRGRYDPIRPGDRIAPGRGIVIDITESKLDGRAEDRAFFLSEADEADEMPLDRAADLALALHQEAVAHEQTVPGLVSAARLALILLRKAGEAGQDI
jgi:hypothetical protein